MSKKETTKVVEVSFLDKRKTKFQISEKNLKSFLEGITKDGCSFTDIKDGHKFTVFYPAHMIGRVSVGESNV